MKRSTPFDPDAGWARLERFLSADDVATTLSVCRELLGAPRADRRVGDKAVSGTHHLVELDERSEFIDAVLERPALMDLVGEILGPTFRRDQVSYRSPQPTFGGQLLHADAAPLSAPATASVATAIVALVPFTEMNGATRLVPGSHLRPDLQRESGRMPSHPDEITLLGDAGTAFVFSGHVLHSGTTNSATRERPALQLVWRTSGESPVVRNVR